MKNTSWVLAGGILAGVLLASAGSEVLADEFEAGKKIYKGEGCSICHQIDGKGGKLGPDLSDIGQERGRDWIADFLRDPKGTKPESKHKVAKAGGEDFDALVDYLASLKKED